MPFTKNPLFNDIPRPLSVSAAERAKIIAEASDAADHDSDPETCPYEDDDRMDLWFESYRTRKYQQH